MARIKVKAKKSWSEGERKLARKAVEFALDALDLRVTPVPIDIRLKGKSETDLGDSIDLEYKIVVRLHKTDNWLSTLFHELEHARQYIYCELQLEHNHAIWRGTLSTRNAEDWEQYWNSPWEIAAREKEVELLAAFQKNLLTSSS